MASKYTGVTPFNGGWQYRIKRKLPDGTKIDTTCKYDDNGLPFQTARAAYEARRAHESRLSQNPSESLSVPAVTILKDVYANYLKTEGKTKTATTIRKQDSMWDNHICPRFGDRDINTITIVELSSFLNEMYQSYAYSYVEGFLKFFYLLFGHAVRMEVFTDLDRYNRMFVFKDTRLCMPSKKQVDYDEDEVVVYSDEEISIMEKAFSSDDGNLKLAFHLGLHCGLRISECFGLRWRNINWDEGYIRIERQLQYVDGCWHLVPVKTLSGSRKVYITEDFQEELWFYFSAQSQYKEELKEGYRNYERVYDSIEKRWLGESDRDFVNRKKNGELLTINSMKYYAKKINPLLREYAEFLQKAKQMGNCGIYALLECKEFKYHNLRHTFASRCASHNVNMYMLMNMMGHKKIDTTKKYYISIEDDYAINHVKKILSELYE